MNVCLWHEDDFKQKTNAQYKWSTPRNFEFAFLYEAQKLERITDYMRFFFRFYLIFKR